MIVAPVTDPVLRAALVRAARPDEDVVWEEDAVLEALYSGFPRILVRLPEDGHPAGPALDYLSLDVPDLTLNRAMLRSWDRERRRTGRLRGRVEDATLRLRLAIREVAEPTWVDDAFLDLGRAAGAPMPRSLRGLGRRVMEFPAHYADLGPLAAKAGLSRGALKARFRRRDLPSPYTYLRWFRIFAAAHALADRSRSIADVAHTQGYSHGGNFCRTVQDTTGMTPSSLRSVQGWSRLVVAFAWRYVVPFPADVWDSLDDLFLRRAA